MYHNSFQIFDNLEMGLEGGKCGNVGKMEKREGQDNLVCMLGKYQCSRVEVCNTLYTVEMDHFIHFVHEQNSFHVTEGERATGQAPSSTVLLKGNFP